jgi:hypothetical protein
MKLNHSLLKNVGFPRAPIRRSFESHVTLNSQRTGLKSVKVSPVDGEPDKCYKWTGRGAVRNNVKHMVCCGCRAIWDKMPVGERPSLPTMKFDLERNEWIDIFPNNHIFVLLYLKIKFVADKYGMNNLPMLKLQEVNLLLLELISLKLFPQDMRIYQKMMNYLF